MSSELEPKKIVMSFQDLAFLLEIESISDMLCHPTCQWLMINDPCPQFSSVPGRHQISLFLSEGQRRTFLQS